MSHWNKQRRLARHHRADPNAKPAQAVAPASSLEAFTNREQQRPTMRGFKIAQG
ncbi:MAG: hypothetical protein ABSF95_23445 [Verrucomicrobiota bacterium]